MLEKLIFADKANIDLQYFFGSIGIVHSNNGQLSRYQFERNMELYMNGHTSLAPIEPENFSNPIRTQYNKSKAPRYFGFLDLNHSTNNGNPDLVLTKRGYSLASMLVKVNDKFILSDDKWDDFQKLIIGALIYDSFGKNNPGLESTNSDVEPPKAILKALLSLDYITSEESVYIVYGLQTQTFESLDEIINNIKQLRTVDSNQNHIKQSLITWGFIGMTPQEIQAKIDRYASPHEYINIANDNKLLAALCLFKILYRDEERKYHFVQSILERYRSEFQKLIPYYTPHQLIISGIPGTGKSYYVENSILGRSQNTYNVIRISIHSDFSYSDFIGYISPKSVSGKIEYSFVPGPFTQALAKALIDTKSNFYLVIEEFNRGNISSIFGDIFQLLDRIDNYTNQFHGWSRYSIKNQHVYNYLKSELNTRNPFTNNEIKMPSNLSIISTMNTADQNVFILDTAFRRRFKNIYMRINFGESTVPNTYLKKINDMSTQYVFSNGKSWVDFAKYINALIDRINQENLSISDDKKLAQFFVNENDVMSKKNFCNKVLYYLKSDVFKHTAGVLSLSYDAIYEKVVNENIDIFEIFGTNQYE